MEINKVNIKRLYICLILFVLMTFSLVETVEAYDTAIDTSSDQSTKEAQAGSLDLRTEDIPNTSYEIENPLKLARLSESSLMSSFDLRDHIPENVVVKNQLQNPGCWIFSSLGALESNLALIDYYNGITNRKQYNFSERHMEYSTVKEFLNGEINEYGFNRKPGAGGNFFVAAAYLTSGLGAVDESDMPYEENTDLIELSKIQNKTVTSQVLDTAVFSYHTPAFSDIEEFKTNMKNHIINYGGLTAAISSPAATSKYYNYDTGAYYCDIASNCRTDHSVLIVGWDDNYDKSNFGSTDIDNPIQPKNNGAWIVKNSWGEKAEYTVEELVASYRKSYCSKAEYMENCTEENGWADNTDEIPLEEIIKAIEDNKYELSEDGTKYTRKCGNNGFYYYSYEDINIYNYVAGVVKSTNSTNYDNIYQHNYLGYNKIIDIPVDDKLYVADIFKRNNTNEKEYLTEVALDVIETNTVKVYINPNGSGIEKEELQLVELEAGESETFNAGYHTLEFLNPIELTGEEFAVVIEIEGTREIVSVKLETPATSGKYTAVTIDGQGVYSTEMGNWTEFTNMDTTIKAFTISEIEKLEITTPATKTNYIEGQDFDTTGMIVSVVYKDGTKLEITDYTVEDGYNLNKDQTAVTIKYQDKSVAQVVTVEENIVESIKIEEPATKTNYIEGQNFDKTGMVVKAYYKNGNIVEITDYIIENGEELKAGQSEVKVIYEGQSATQKISVREKLMEGIKIVTPPVKTEYIEGQSFDKLGMVVVVIYEDDTTKEITDYTIKNGNELQKNQTSVTISYNEFEVLQTITVKEKVIEKKVESISIKQLPTKTKYLQNKEVLDLSGGIITITYNDGTTEEIEMTSPNIEQSGYDNTNPGTMIITLIYETKSVEFNVEIEKEEVEPEEPIEPEIPPVEVNPENSNFSNSSGNITNIEAYYYVEKDKENYVVMETIINDVEKSSINDSLEYYYYLSSSQDEGYKEDWVKINEVQNVEENNLKFTINTKDITNYEDVSKSDVLYLYIKEVAIKNTKQTTVISKPMQLKSNVVIKEYVDDNLKGNLGSNDDGIAGSPETGDWLFNTISIISILSLGCVIYYFNQHSKSKA